MNNNSTIESPVIISANKFIADMATDLERAKAEIENENPTKAREHISFYKRRKWFLERLIADEEQSRTEDGVQ